MTSETGLASGGRIQELIQLTERLTALVAEQAQAFEAGRPQDAAGNMEETSRLAMLYWQESQSLHDNPAPIAALPRRERLKLIQATEAFDAVMARQGRALSAAKTVTEGLVHAIAEEIATQRGSNATYGASGAKAATNAAVAVTLNRRA
jgi:hypothetical protein